MLASQRDTWKAFVDGHASHHRSGPCLTGRAHLRTRLAPLRLSPAREAEIVDELSQHLDDRYEALRAAATRRRRGDRLALEELHETRHPGAGDARAAAGTDRRRRSSKARRDARLIQDLLQDLRYAARMLRKQPGFTAAAVITLALGIGANTAVFSLVNATLFQRLPAADPERLVYMYRGASGVFSYPQYAMLRDHAQSFDGLAGWGGIMASLNAGDSAELVPGIIATGNFFDVLGVQPALGRLLRPSDDVTPGAHPVVGDRLRLLADALRRPPRRRRPRDPPERPRLHDRRRGAGRVPGTAARKRAADSTCR